MSDSSQTVLEMRDVTCGTDGHALHRLSLRLDAGAFHVLTGGPADQRAVLLRVIGLLDAPMCGEIILEDCALGGIADSERDELRNQRCGFLFASPFLLPSFSVVENVAMPLFKISHFSATQARERTELLLDFVGLTAEAQQPVEALTAFQQHAVSLARALANGPAVITVENLDTALGPEDSANFASLLRQCCAHFDVAVIASVSGDFMFEAGDRVFAIDAAGVVRESIMEGKPLP
jgi:ABC-type lipoprotein export system ATPase subunit